MSILEARYNSYTEKEKAYIASLLKEGSYAIEIGDIQKEEEVNFKLKTIADFHFATRPVDYSLEITNMDLKEMYPAMFGTRVIAVN